MGRDTLKPERVLLGANKNAFRREYDLLAWKYAGDLPMTQKDVYRLHELHHIFLNEVLT